MVYVRRCGGDAPPPRLRDGGPGLAVLVTVAGVLACPVAAAAQSPQKVEIPQMLARDYERVFEETFDAPLGTIEEGSGIWSTQPRRDLLATNGPAAVFLSETVLDPEGAAIGVLPHSVEDGVLHIRSGALSGEQRAAVQRVLEATGQGERAADLRYYTGMIATDRSWAQRYGYFEIRARVPEGKGHWPAFWLAPAGIGWPPEIDIFEAYGRGIGGRTKHDDAFEVSVYFDAIDAAGKPGQRTDYVNPHFPDQSGAPQQPAVKTVQGGTQHVFSRRFNALQDFDADIYSGFWTYAAEWTPDHIAFFFGPDRDSLVEVYRTPTPEDVTTPMYLIANDQITSNWGWNPQAGLDARTFAASNAYQIDSVAVYARRPDRVRSAEASGAPLLGTAEDERLVGTDGDDRIVTGSGQDILSLGQGSDTVTVVRGQGNTIIEGLGPDDRLKLEEFYFDGAGDAMDRLTQVGRDVWLMNGAFPANPQTIILRETSVADLSPDQFAVRWSVTPDVWSSRRLNPDRLADEDGDGLVVADPRGSKMTDAGSTGSVVLRGGPAGDLYFVHKAGTTIEEEASGGVDSVQASVDTVLPAHVENLAGLGDRGDLALSGNDADNRLQAGPAGSRLRGAGGSDLLVLREGPDCVIFGPGAGHDAVVNLSPDDCIILEGYPDLDPAGLPSRLTEDGDDLRLDLGQGDSITLRGTPREAVTPKTFVAAKG